MQDDETAEQEQLEPQAPQYHHPQPVPMGISAGVVPLADGTDRVMVTYASVNGSWTVFYDRDGAVAHAKNLLALAFQPPPDPEG